MRHCIQTCFGSKGQKTEEGRVTMEALPSIHRGPGLAVVTRLLESASLPSADLLDGHMQDFFYAGPATAPTGIVGVQLYGSDALLRSLVVIPAHRKQGLGQKLVEHAEHHARERGAGTVYLLTTTAEAFFRARGYAVTPRDSAPAAIRSTPEFAGLCPASSAFLSKRL